MPLFFVYASDRGNCALNLEFQKRRIKKKKKSLILRLSMIIRLFLTAMRHETKPYRNLPLVRSLGY